MEQKKTTSVELLRGVLYQQIDAVQGPKFDNRKAKAIIQTASQIFTSYKIQLEAMKLIGKKNISNLTGLLK